MKKLFYFTALVFIVSLFLSSCKKDDNPVTNNPNGGTPSTFSWTSEKKSGLNIPINNGFTFDSINPVIPPDFFPTNYIKNVNLTLDSITGVDASQLKFDLIHNGHTIRVIDTLNNGGPGNSFIRTVLSDSSSDPIRTASSPYSGIYQPANPLSILRDSPPEGSYVLRILNSGNLRTGVIKSWGITISYSSRISNYCLEFNGTNQYAQIPSSNSINSILTNGTFTLEGWYKILGYTSDYFSFLDKQSSWYCEYSRRDTAWTFVEPGDTTAKAKFPVAFDTWYHIAITYNAPSGTVRFYSNGVLIGTFNQTFTFVTNSSPLYIACGISGATEYGKGRFDEIRIWNVVRSESEISENYNKSLTGNENGLVLYYKLNEASGIDIGDVSPNGNNGFLYNNPIWSADGPNITK